MVSDIKTSYLLRGEIIVLNLSAAEGGVANAGSI
jgi:hypothetical protein